MRLLSLSLTLTCQVRGAGSHVATPGLCLRGCQDLPGAGSYGAPVWTGGWGCPPGLEQGACWLSLSAGSGFQPAAGSGVATGVAPCPRGSHPWQQAAREENMAEEGVSQMPWPAGTVPRPGLGHGGRDRQSPWSGNGPQRGGGPSRSPAARPAWTVEGRQCSPAGSCLGRCNRMSGSWSRPAWQAQLSARVQRSPPAGCG